MIRKNRVLKIETIKELTIFANLSSTLGSEMNYYFSNGLLKINKNIKREVFK